MPARTLSNGVVDFSSRALLVTQKAPARIGWAMLILQKASLFADFEYGQRKRLPGFEPGNDRSAGGCLTAWLQTLT